MILFQHVTVKRIIKNIGLSNCNYYYFRVVTVTEITRICCPSWNILLTHCLAEGTHLTQTWELNVYCMRYYDSWSCHRQLVVHFPAVDKSSIRIARNWIGSKHEISFEMSAWWRYSVLWTLLLSSTNCMLFENHCEVNDCKMKTAMINPRVLYVVPWPSDHFQLFAIANDWIVGAISIPSCPIYGQSQCPATSTPLSNSRLIRIEKASISVHHATSIWCCSTSQVGMWTQYGSQVGRWTQYGSQVGMWTQYGSQKRHMVLAYFMWFC